MVFFSGFPRVFSLVYLSGCRQSMLTALFYAVFRLLLSPESVLTALLAALSVFGVLWGLRTLAYRRDGDAQFGLGDVYLMAGLGMWFSFPEVLWIISGAAISGGPFLLARRLRHPMLWQENVNYRSAPFAPFLCGVAAITHFYIFK